MFGEWRHSLRVILIAGIGGIAVAVVFGLRERTELKLDVQVERIDPEAVIQTRGSRFIQADQDGDNFRISSGAQSTYEDGRMRWFDHVTMTVADREGRIGFNLSGQSATVDSDQTNVEIEGRVEMRSTDGLSATTEMAYYTHEKGFVEIPVPASFGFSRDGMEASGRKSSYDRNTGTLRLFESSEVSLLGSEMLTVIRSRLATLDNAVSIMLFNGDVNIGAGSNRMKAGQARAVIRAENNNLEVLELREGATISSSSENVGALESMKAEDIDLSYGTDNDLLSKVGLFGQTMIHTVGPRGGSGSSVSSQEMEITFESDGISVNKLVAREDVRLALPVMVDGSAQSVSSKTVSIFSGTGSGLDVAEFEGGVEFREVERESESASVLTTASERLTATLSDGLSSLEKARFLGNVVLNDDGVVAQADEAMYTLSNREIELVKSQSNGRLPRMVDKSRGAIQGAKIILNLSSGSIYADGDVESVLSRQDQIDGEAQQLPTILDTSEAVYITATSLSYDEEVQVTSYSGGTRMWQSSTVFVADEIDLYDLNGNLAASGAVRTEFLLSQINDETGLQEETLTFGQAQEFEYNNDMDLATYFTEASISGSRGDISGDLIKVYLQSDGRTLDRIEADGNVELVMPARRVSGDSLVYYDLDGRYETRGNPVRITEQEDEGCRETTGRVLVFFLTDDAVSVDGQSEVRTEAASVSCPSF